MNLDYAASAPALVAVAEAVDGAAAAGTPACTAAPGFQSRVATAAYEGAREAVRSISSTRAPTTRSSSPATRPTRSTCWRRRCPTARRVIVVRRSSTTRTCCRGAQRGRPSCRSSAEPERLARRGSRALRWPRAGDGRRLVAVTGASNVTGEIWPVAESSQLAHEPRRALLRRRGAACAAPADRHGREPASTTSRSPATSSTPRSAPARSSAAATGSPSATRSCGAAAPSGSSRVDDVVWAELPDRQEAGSPNVLGAVALGRACDDAGGVGMDRQWRPRSTSSSGTRAERLGAIPGVRAATVWDRAPAGRRVHVQPRGLPYDLLAAVRRREHGIGVRHGCFCAHPLMMRLLRVDAGGGPADGRDPPSASTAAAGRRAHQLWARLRRARTSSASPVRSEPIASDGPRWLPRNRTPTSTSPIPIPASSRPCRCGWLSTLTVTASLPRSAPRRAGRVAPTVWVT